MAVHFVSPSRLKIEGTTAFVEIFLNLAGGEIVDLTEEVYIADISVFQSMDFGPSLSPLLMITSPPRRPLQMLSLHL